MPPLRWVADAMMILSSEVKKVEWHRFCLKARELHLTLPLAAALGYLYKSLDAPVPLDVLADLKASPVSPGDYYHYRNITGSPRELGILWRFKRQSARYRRLTLNAKGPRKWRLLLQFLVLGCYEFCLGILWPRLKGDRTPAH